MLLEKLIAEAWGQDVSRARNLPRQIGDNGSHSRLRYNFCLWIICF